MLLTEPSEEVNGIWDSDDEDVYVDDGILPTYHTIAEGDEDFSHIPLGPASPLNDVNGSVLPLKDTADNTFGPALPPKAANESSPPKDSNVQVLTRAGRLNPPQNATQTQNNAHFTHLPPPPPEEDLVIKQLKKVKADINI